MNQRPKYFFFFVSILLRSRNTKKKEVNKSITCLLDLTIHEYTNKEKKKFSF